MTSKVPRTLIIFHRHGHRSPSKNIISNSSKSGLCYLEEQSWSTHCNISSTVETLDKKHPVTCPPQIKLPHDLVSFPFGCLTSLGLKCLEQQATNLCEVFPYIKSFNIDSGANARICSTNYKRTQVGRYLYFCYSLLVWHHCFSFADKCTSPVEQYSEAARIQRGGREDQDSHTGAPAC